MEALTVVDKIEPSAFAARGLFFVCLTLRASRRSGRKLELGCHDAGNEAGTCCSRLIRLPTVKEKELGRAMKSEATNLHRSATPACPLPS